MPAGERIETIGRTKKDWKEICLEAGTQKQYIIIINKAEGLVLVYQGYIHDD